MSFAVRDPRIIHQGSSGMELPRLQGWYLPQFHCVALPRRAHRHKSGMPTFSYIHALGPSLCLCLFQLSVNI